MTHIVPRQIRLNSFDKSTFAKIKSILQSVPSELYKGKQTAKIAQLIEAMSPWTKQEMMWVVAVEPAYFLQYKKNASALFVIDEVTVIVYAPKHLEYPQLVDLPKFQQRQCPAKIEAIDRGEDTTSTLVDSVVQFIEKYYSTFHGQGIKTADFQTELLKNVKYYLSRYSRNMYWHAVFGGIKTNIHQFSTIPVRIKLKIEAAGQKYLYLYSLKGHQDPIRNIIKSKWKQIASFILLFVLLLTVVACPSVPKQEETDELYQFNKASSNAFCANKSTIYYVIGGFFFLSVGFNLANRKKPKMPIKTN